MKKENEKKKVILMIVGVITLILVVVGATFAYFQAQIGKGENTKLEATTGTTDSLTFNITDIDVSDSDNKILDENNNEDANIIINANQGNFGQNDNSLGDGVNLNAHLIAGDDDNEASYTYNLYLDISKNDLEYTSYKYNDKVISFKTKEEKEKAYNEGIETEEGDYLYIEDLEPIPELVLVVQKPNGNYVDSIGNLSKSEITIEGKSVPCFDITEVNSIINIAIDYRIEATEENEGIEDQNWQVRVIFKNLETNQHLNTGKSFTASLSIQSEKINYLDLASYADCDEYGYCEYTDYRAGEHYDEELDDYVAGYNEQIKNVYFVNKMAEESELNSVAKWDLSSSKDKSIMGWLKENQDQDVPYDLYIGSNLKDDEKIKVRSLANAFYGLSNVETIDLNPSILDTSNLISTENMFGYDANLMNIIGLENLDVFNVTDMHNMFFLCVSIRNINISNWNTHNVTDMSNMFTATRSLTEIIGIGDLDVSNVTDMSDMFGSYTPVVESFGNNISELDLSQWNVSNVIDMSRMFENASSLTILKLNNWNLSGTKLYNDTYGPFYDMFSGTDNLQTIEGIESWNVSEVTNMSNMFDGASSLTKLDLSQWNVSNVTDMSYMFSSASSLTAVGDISNWDTQNIVNMSGMFRYASSLTTLGDLSNWDIQNIVNMYGVFEGANSSIIPDISKWNTSKVEDMSSLFSNTAYNYDVSKIDTSQVTDMSFMFSQYKGTEITGIENLDVSNVTDMSSMFSEASGITELDLSGWDTSNVTDMSKMFVGASSLTSIDMTNATFHQVKKYDRMFVKSLYGSTDTLDVILTITGQKNKQWFIDNNVLEEEKLNVLKD